ncbi:hypothetical protein RFM26_26320 [Mesorhizobium sp. VK23B]|uniref:Uncharacterized protein n=1 Tax=Mesorhizobium dulcispinae TaxID=3072316 RepID=A0ABU4XLN2_9HYPH|nr:MULTISPECIES: hypothetical protein [unclassified Mesorhizobium]MDX8469219.1 hypothetical protein [Mesorhizobium sp. VK23B]MDX8475648.1 hypothetical protein [Mesorhizobium sp. VK23A]
MKRLPSERIIARFTPPAWMEQRIGSLSKKLADCKDAAQRRHLSAELSRLQRTMGGPTVVKPDSSPEASRVPLPRSYTEDRQADQGRRAHFRSQIGRSSLRPRRRPRKWQGGYVNNVIKGKLLESETLAQQAANNTKEQFANSPDLSKAILDAIIDAFEAHTTMSKQALDSAKIREGLKDVLLGPGQLWEELRGARER